MSSRKPGYLVSVVLFAIILSVPPGFLVLESGVAALKLRRWPLPKIPGFGGHFSGSNRITNSVFWRDQFVHIDCVTHFGRAPNPIQELRLTAIDPETGITSQRLINAPYEIPSNTQLKAMVFGDRLWLFERSFKIVPISGGLFTTHTAVDTTSPNHSSLEVVDDIARPSALVDPGPTVYRRARSGFLHNGEPAFIKRQPNHFEISIFSGGTWTRSAVIVPQSVQLLGNSRTNFSNSSPIECFNHGDKFHLFAVCHSRLLYREGLELRPLSLLEQQQEGLLRAPFEDDQPSSALAPVNTEAAIEDWSVVGPDSYDHPLTTAASGLLVERKPAGVIADFAQTDNPSAKVYRLVGRDWTYTESVSFPFGTRHIDSVTCQDGEKSYIVASTSVGWAYVYRIDASGIRLVMSKPPEIQYVLDYMIREYTNFPNSESSRVSFSASSSGL